MLTYLILAASLAVDAEAAMKGPVPYQAYTATTDMAVWDVAVRDINGDGRAEVFALCGDPKSDPLQKRLAIFSPDATGRYPAHPTTSVSLPSAASLLFFAKSGEKESVDLVAADTEGATVFRAQGNAFVEKSRVPFLSLLPSSTKEPLFIKNAAIDLDGDNVDEWLIPVPGGYELRTEAGVKAKITCDMGGELRAGDSLGISYRLPACRTFDLPDSPQGVALLSVEYADFGYGKNWTEHKRFRVPGTLDGKWDAYTSMDDINGDKFPDLIITQTQGTFDIKSVTNVYIATHPFEYPEKPTATYSASGALGAPFLVDVNGDKKLDMVFINVPVGVRSLLNFFVRRKITATAQVYLFENGRFAATPNYEETLIFDAPQGRERVVYEFGDFNGDGRLDVAYGSPGGKLDIRLGETAKFLSPKPWVSIPLPTFGVAREFDLNGNKCNDLVLFHPGGDNKTRIDIVVF